MGKNRHLIFLLAGLLVLVLGCQASPGATSEPTRSSGSQASPTEPEATPQGPADQVLLALDWIIGGQHSPFYVAIDKGFYAEQNLSVTIVRGHGSGDTVRRVASKGADFGFADTGPLISAKAQENVDVKLVAAIYADPPHAIYYNRERGISSPKDLEGKTLADSAFSAIKIMWPVFADANQIDDSKVNWKTVDPAAVNPSFLTGDVDGIGQFTISAVTMQRQAQETGIDVGRMRYVDHGLSFYGNGLLAHTDTIASNPDLVRRFVAATIKGYEYALENQGEAIEIHSKYHRDPPADVAAEELGLVEELVLTDATREDGIGSIDADRMASTVTLVTEALDLPSVDPEDLYTLEFLPD